MAKAFPQLAKHLYRNSTVIPYIIIKKIKMSQTREIYPNTLHVQIRYRPHLISIHLLLCNHVLLDFCVQ